MFINSRIVLISRIDKISRIVLTFRLVIISRIVFVSTPVVNSRRRLFRLRQSFPAFRKNRSRVLQMDAKNLSTRLYLDFPIDACARVISTDQGTTREKNGRQSVAAEKAIGEEPRSSRKKTIEQKTRRHRGEWAKKKRHGVSLISSSRRKLECYSNVWKTRSDRIYIVTYRR